VKFKLEEVKCRQVSEVQWRS